MNNLKEILKNKVGNKKLMVIFPHPDDESIAAGGLLILAKKYGWKTVVATLTKGEMGQCYINRDGKDLSEIRTKELKEAVKILNVDKLILGDFKDAKLREYPKQVEKWISRILVNENPSIVVTYDPSGFSGHSDHIYLSVAILKILKSFKNNIDLYWVSLPKKLGNLLINKKTFKFALTANYQLNLGFNWYKKLVAVKKHRSQKLDDGKPLLFVYLAILHREWYYKVDLKKDYKYKFVYFKI